MPIMQRLTNSSVLLGERIHKLRYIGFGFLLFDLVYGFLLITFFESIRLTALGYHTFTFLYVCAVLSGMFGIKDKIGLLLYPILIYIVSLMLKMCISFNFKKSFNFYIFELTLSKKLIFNSTQIV